MPVEHAVVKDVQPRDGSLQMLIFCAEGIGAVVWILASGSVSVRIFIDRVLVKYGKWGGWIDLECFTKWCVFFFLECSLPCWECERDFCRESCWGSCERCSTKHPLKIEDKQADKSRWVYSRNAIREIWNSRVKDVRLPLLLLPRRRVFTTLFFCRHAPLVGFF